MSPQKEGNPSDCNIPPLFLCGKEFKPDFLKHYIMITPQLIEPRTIAVIGASQDVTKPGGKVLQNILNGSFQGRVLGVNPKVSNVQGVECVPDVKDLPQVDLAILAIPARFCPPTIEVLVKEKGTKGIIVFSAGFSEMGAEGKALERQMAELANEAGATLIGPNCVGVMNPLHQSVFTTPVPVLTPKGCDFISGSGATAVFIMESALSKGLSFSSVYSVGNAAQTGVEDVLEHLDETFDAATSSHTLLLYIETISKPKRFLKHARSLVQKGCRIAAIKSGTSSDGGRAAASHTGAMLNSDVAVDALFRKAGVVRCYSREELATVGSVLQHPVLTGKNMAVITHAGGPAVMLTDALSNGGMSVPPIPEEKTRTLLSELFDGSSVANPIDILATGTAEQLSKVIDTCEKDLDTIDGMVVIFGSPGLFDVSDAYDVIREQQKKCKKPIYAVLPSVINAKEGMERFIAQGGILFEEEVALARAICKVYQTPKPEMTEESELPKAAEIRRLLAGKSGMLGTGDMLQLLDLTGITRPQERLVTTETEALDAARSIGFPLAMKVMGLAHKSDAGGVILNVSTEEGVKESFGKLMQIKGAEGVQVSQMESGVEVFIGVKKEGEFGHLITCGLGGIFVEVMKDIRCALAPLGKNEALEMIRSLKSYPIIRGIRGKQGINDEVIADTLCKISRLLAAVPEIEEMDINPLMGRGERLSAVDVVVRLSDAK